MGALGSPGAHQQLTRADKPIRAFEAAERHLDLDPGRFPLGLGEPGQHLVQRTERLAFELCALGGAREPKRRLDPAHLDIREPTRDQELIEVRRREWTRQPGAGGGSCAFVRMIEIGTEKNPFASASAKTRAA